MSTVGKSLEEAVKTKAGKLAGVISAWHRCPMAIEWLERVPAAHALVGQSLPANCIPFPTTSKSRLYKTFREGSLSAKLTVLVPCL